MTKPDIIVMITDQERAIPPYESDAMRKWRDEKLTGRKWFSDHGVSFERHYTGSLACVPSRPTMFTGQFPDVHGVTQTDGLGKMFDDSRMRWLRPGEVPTLGNWFDAGGYDTTFVGKWHVTHADLHRPDGSRIATNDDDGNLLADGIRAYDEADPLAPFGFSGWIGPEPHGAARSDSGLVRDPIFADRAVAWLEDRYSRRATGDRDAARPFLLVVCFVNPHDIVFHPAWQVRSSPLEPSPNDPPHEPAPPTADEDLRTKPAAQVAYREAYPSAYGPPPLVRRSYRKDQALRDTYHRLHLEVDGPLDRVRRAVTEGGSTDAVLVRTADHGELLGAHGGLQQKWFNLYDEATRVPFQVARIGNQPTAAATVDAVTSHVDLVPTLLAAAGIDPQETMFELASSFSEVHPLPGRDLGPVVGGAEPDPTRAVYLQTRDNMIEGDSSVSGFARAAGRMKPPPPLRIRVPAHVAANFEAVVTRVDGTLWKIVRTFDDPATWTEPGVRHLAADGPEGLQYRTEPLSDQWELYDLDSDPIEAVNRADDDTASAVFATMKDRLKAEFAAQVPERNEPWPYASRQPTNHPSKDPRPPQKLARRLLRRLGLHPDDEQTFEGDVDGRRALVIATNHGILDIGKPTGVFASEMTAPYYVFLDAGMEVDVASPKGGAIPVDPQSLRAPVRSEHDDRFMADDDFRAKVNDSLAVADLDMDDYDIVFLAGGWGAAFDFATSTELADAITAANAVGAVIGGVCHGPLGLIGALDTDGTPLVEGRKISAVTDKQVHELGIDSTPFHPETELRKVGADFESETARRDFLANHWAEDGNLVTGQNQNAGPMVARRMMELLGDE
ncbi:MAG TPA: sulfatase-like hydrolase/transferase [Acidimicrobiales bacterium]|nr:sulfatase-like hydrolase/transferase [Acidimicrobiales bacterium]